MDHLIGETVQVCGDGADLGEFVVDESGEVDVSPQTAEVAHIGLQMISRFKPMKFDIDNVAGNSQGQTKQMHRVDFQFYTSMGVDVFDAEGKQVNIKWRDMTDNTNTAIPFFTGPKVAAVNGRPNRDICFTVVQDKPLPMTILGITARYEIAESIG